MDQQRRRQQMREQLQQLARLVHAAAHLVEVHGEGHDKADLRELGGLKGDRPDLVPGIVVAAGGRIADDEFVAEQAEIPQHQRGQHQPPRDGYMKRPHVHQVVVVDAREQHGRRQPHQGGRRLHQRAAVAAEAADLPGDGIIGEAAELLHADGHQHDAGEHAAPEAHGKIGPVRAPEIAGNRLHGTPPPF
jgi:hypothetical protein